MPVYLSNATRKTGLDFRAVERTAEALLAAVDERDSSVSISFVRDPAIQAINREHRGKDAPTDVLSFPLFEPEAFDRSGPTRPRARDDASERMLGDIVVSVDTAQRQAAAYDAPLDREVERLLIHAVLHLTGHDHEAEDERERMEREERRLAAAIGMPWPYLEGQAS
jgi:probable rRNA maturation factor